MAVADKQIQLIPKCDIIIQLMDKSQTQTSRVVPKGYSELYIELLKIFAVYIVRKIGKTTRWTLTWLGIQIKVLNLTLPF